MQFSSSSSLGSHRPANPAFKRAFCILIMLTGALPGVTRLQAQTEPNLENGFKPSGTYSGSDIDTVNLMNGNVMLHIPMPFGLPQRGTLTPSYFLGISSKQWSKDCTGASCQWFPAFVFQALSPALANRGTGVGFDNSLDLSVQRTTHTEVDTVNSAPTNSYEYLNTVTTPDGATHGLFPGPITNDISGFQVIEPGAGPNVIPTDVTIKDKAGDVYATGGWQTLQVLNQSIEQVPDPNHPGQFGQRIITDALDVAYVTGVTDPNGNQIVFGGQDTMGRTITLPGFSGTQTTTDYSHCVSPASQPINSATISNYIAFNGSTNQIKVCYSNISLATNFGVAEATEWPPTGINEPPVPMIVSVIFLADDLTWSFQYDSYGNVTYVGLPLGGSIQYVWETHAFPSPNPAVVSRAVQQRTVSDNNGNSYVWRYQYGTAAYPNAFTNVVTDPLGNDTATTFGALPPVYLATTTKTYQGSQGSGLLLKQVDQQYYDNGQTGNNHVATAFVTQITTTVNGNVSQATRVPDTTYGFGFGMPTVEKQYDYGPGHPGALLREIDTGYMWQGTSTSAQQYLAANIVGVPSSIQVKDGNGNVCSETDNGYDDPTRLTAYTGTIPNHGAAPNAVRGNLTSTSRKLTTTACSITTSMPSVTSYTNWYDTGETYQQIDPLGHTTTHSYDLAYFGAYSTKTCNAASQCVTGTYDFNTGVLTSFTNANATTPASGNKPGDSAHTIVYGYDALSRLTAATFPPDPDNGNAQSLTQFSYPMPVTLPFTVTRTKSVTSKLSDSTTNTYDGLGRGIKSVHTSANNATVVTQYDGLDHIISVTNPYFSTSDLSYGAIQTQYDALGRVVQVAPPDGTALTLGGAPSACQANNTCTDYSGFPVVSVTDQAGKIRRSRADALGRMVEVREPGPGINSGGTTGAGSINISGSLASSLTGGAQATGWFIVGGGEQSFTPTQNCYPDPNTGNWVCDPPGQTIYDSGSIDIGVGSFGVFTGFDQNTSGPGDLASNLAGSLNASSSPVTAYYPGSGSTVWLTAKQQGPNLALIQSVAYDNQDFQTPSFTVQLSGSSLTGGVYPVTTYDSGTLSVTVSGPSISSFTASASYNQNLNNTAQLMANALASALSVPSSPVTATANGTTINITARGIGTASDYTITGGSSRSFTASSTTLSGGTNPSGIYAPYVTTYSYDPPGNLLQVKQLGDGSQAARVRTFSYDSLSRLLTSQNPETGTVAYSYDADGDMLQKVAPQANQAGSGTQTISYCYDRLNRVTGRAYSAQTCQSGQLPAGTAAVSYTYDAGTNALGRLTSMTDQAGSASYGYNVLGRLTSEQHTINGTASVTKSVGYSYNLDSSLKTFTYPSGTVLTYAPDAAGRAVSAIDNGAAINYITSATFSADNSLTGFTSGKSATFAGITNTFVYNQRLQPCRITASSTGAVPTNCVNSWGNVLDLSYDFHLAAGDNGNIYGITNYRDQTRNQTFAYDQLNRLASAHNAGTDCTKTAANGMTQYWGNNYGYDPWGNLLSETVTKCSSDNLNVSADAQNRIHAVSGTDYQYDAAGNMTHDATANLNYTYDQENRIAGAAGYTYTYDGNGNRVKKTNGSTGTIYWYASVGPIAESDLSGNMQHEYIFFGGRRVARKDVPSNAVSYYFSDHLNSASVITDSAGNIKAESDYRPFGAEVQFTNNDGNDYKFTGQKRDTESGLDFFGARYYSNAFGRFVTPDWSTGPATVPYAHLDNPQTLNLYRYVPVTGIDPDGHRFESIVGEGGGWGLDTLVVGVRLLSTQDLIDKLAKSRLPGELPRLTPDPTQIDPDGPCYTEEALARMKGTAPSVGAAHRGEVYSYGAVWMSAFAMYNQSNNGLNGATAFIDYCDVPSPTSEDFKGGEEPHMELGNQIYTRTNPAKNDPQYVDLNKGAEDSQVGSGYVGLSVIPVAAAMNEEVTACANKRYATPANHPWVPGPGPAVWSNPFKESPYPQK